MDQEKAWGEVAQLINVRQAESYRSAVAVLKDLRDAAAMRGQTAAFSGRLGRAMREHARKGLLIEAIRRAGLT
jgi:uncharacterized Zn finger protein